MTKLIFVFVLLGVLFWMARFLYWWINHKFTKHNWQIGNTGNNSWPEDSDFFFFLIIFKYKEAKNSQQVYSFNSIHFLLWIHGLLDFIIQLLFADERVRIVECRQFIQKTFIVQTKLKMICRIKLWPSSGFPCFGKHYVAKSVHVYVFV